MMFGLLLAHNKNEHLTSPSAQPLKTLEAKQILVSRSDSACIFTKRFFRSENTGFPTLRE
jgi:hypothetical protein